MYTEKTTYVPEGTIWTVMGDMSKWQASGRESILLQGKIWLLKQHWPWDLLRNWIGEPIYYLGQTAMQAGVFIVLVFPRVVRILEPIVLEADRTHRLQELLKIITDNRSMFNYKEAVFDVKSVEELGQGVTIFATPKKRFFVWEGRIFPFPRKCRLESVKKNPQILIDFANTVKLAEMTEVSNE
ncbi:MAG: hypothetical protein QXT73_01240 [Candidatus Methanomethylicaceae archaeon]